jgi:hypothetical protein
VLTIFCRRHHEEIGHAAATDVYHGVLLREIVGVTLSCGFACLEVGCERTAHQQLHQVQIQIPPTANSI